MDILIIKYLAELMFERECVIVPEFGAFISKDVPARLDYGVHRLTPPSREFVFNAQLVSDDDVFANYLCVRQHITHDAATSRLHAFAMQCLAKLEVDGELEFDGVGTLHYVDSQNITFTADTAVNFNGDAFGLGMLTVQPIFRSETYRGLKTDIEERQKMKNTPMTVVGEVGAETPHHVTRSNYRWYRAAAYSLLAATVMVLLGWGADRNGSNFASWNPLFYSSPNEFVFKRLSERYDARETLIFGRIEPVEVKLPIYEFVPELSLEERKVEQPEPVANEQCYSIIGASFDRLEDAERCALQFRKAGFENAMVLPVSRNNKYRVEYEAVAGKDAAVERLEMIKATVNESAWLFIKK